MKRILILWLFLLAWAGVLLGSAGADDLSAPNPSAAEVASDQPRLVVQTGYKGTVDSVAFAPDGRILASREGSTVKLWDVGTGKEVRTLSVEDAVESVAFSPDGRTLASGWGETVTLWDVATGRTVRILSDGSTGGSVVFSPDGRMLASAHQYRDGGITLWDVATGQIVRTLSNGNKVSEIAFSPDGQTLASADSQRSDSGNSGNSDERITLWDVATGRIVRTLSAWNEVGHMVKMSFAFTPDGRILASSGGWTITLWDVATGRIVRVLSVENDEWSLTPDGRTLAMRSDDTAGIAHATIALWDVATGQKVRTLRRQGSNPVSPVFAPDGRMLASVEFLGRRDGDVTLWDVATGQEIRTLRGYAREPSSTVFAPDGRTLAVGTDDGVIILWDMVMGRALRTLRGHEGRIRSMAFAPDGRTLATGDDRSGTVILWDVGTGKEVRTLSGQHDAVMSVAFAPDGRTLASGGSRNGNVTLWDVATGREVRTLQVTIVGGMGVDSVAFAPDGRTLAMTIYDDPIRLWDVGMGKEVRTLSVEDGQRISVAFSPDGRTLASGGIGTVKLWDVVTGREVRALSVEGRVDSVRFSPDGRTLAVIIDDVSTTLWDVATGQKLGTPSEHQKWVGTVLTTIQDMSIRLWRVADGAHLATLFFLIDDSWVVTDPAGRFDTTDLEEIKGVHWVMPDDPLTPVPIEAFMKEYYEPGLLPRLLNGETFPPMRSLSSLNRVQPAVKIAAVQRDGERDTVTVTVEVAKATRNMLRNGQPVPVTTGVHDLKLFRDGQLVGFREGALPLDESGKATVTFTDIRLPRQPEVKAVEFAAYAFNDDGVKSSTHRTPFTLPADLSPAPGKAYLITIGVNRYQNPHWNLNYAAPDAEIIRRMLEARLPQASGYRELISITLTDEQATKANLKSLLDRLAGQKVTLPSAIPNADRLSQATPQDLLILSFSGHGYVDERGIFYAFTHDIGTGTDKTVTADLLRRALSSDELSQWLRDVDAGNMAMIVDACHSAATVGERFKPGPMGSRGLGQLAYDKGMRILAASQADDVALESDRIQHGLLTYALTRDGLEAFQADFQPVDQRIALREWLAYGVDRVPKLYEEVRSGRVSTFGRGESKGLVVHLGDAGRHSLTQRNPYQTPALFDFTRQRRAEVSIALPATP